MTNGSLIFPDLFVSKRDLQMCLRTGDYLVDGLKTLEITNSPESDTEISVELITFAILLLSCTFSDFLGWLLFVYLWW